MPHTSLLNRLYCTAYLGDLNLSSLTESLSNMIAVLEVAAVYNLETSFDLEDLTRTLTIYVTTDSLDNFITELRMRRLTFGILDVYDPEAVRLASSLNVPFIFFDAAGSPV